LDVIKHATVQEKLEVTKEGNLQYVADHAKLHTKLKIVWNKLEVDSKTVLPDALECKIR